MRILIILLLLVSFQVSFSQRKQCSCQLDSFINKNTTSCKTTILSNGSKLYWQFNCNSIWLTLENKNGGKTKIDEVPIGYYSYTYRLGYHLVKEYKKSLLFRYGCPANGPCEFALVNKNNGKRITTFPELIYNHTTQKFYDFIIYFSSKTMLTLYFVEANTKYKIPFNDKDFRAVIPEYQFDDVNLKNNIVTLTYNSTKKVMIDLNRYKH